MICNADQLPEAEITYTLQAIYFWPSEIKPQSSPVFVLEEYQEIASKKVDAGNKRKSS